MRARLLAAAAGCAALTACATPVDGVPTAAGGTSAAAGLPSDVDGLGALVLTEVPGSTVPVPDAELDPPAGAKTVEDVAAYSEDPDRDAEVLADYGYRWGWERFWRPAGGLTTVFVDQFDGVPGAAAYAADLRRNDASYYGGSPDRDPDGLPEGCSQLAVQDPPEETGLDGPSAFVWCAHGPFTVSVAVVAPDLTDASARVQTVVLAQLELLPRG